MATIRLPGTISRSAVTSFLLFGLMSAASNGADLSKYRNFRFGRELTVVAKLTDTNLTQVKVVQSRPALIQDLEWRPQPMGPSLQTDPAKEVLFSFYAGQLFRITVNYDRYETEGMTGDDLVDAISVMYGSSTKPAAPPKSDLGRYGDQEEILAQWQDPQYRFDLVRSSYGPSFKLVGVSKPIETSAHASTIEAARLDAKEAPQREAERLAKEGDTERDKLEKARLVNKPKFRP